MDNNGLFNMYQYQNGMTWEEFVNSDYSESSFMAEGDYVVYVKDRKHLYVCITATNSQGVILNGVKIIKYDTITNIYNYGLIETPEI